MAKIIGNTTTTPYPRPDWNQTDVTKADYIKNKPNINSGKDTSTFSDNSVALGYLAQAGSRGYKILGFDPMVGLTMQEESASTGHMLLLSSTDGLVDGQTVSIRTTSHYVSCGTITINSPDISSNTVTLTTTKEIQFKLETDPDDPEHFVMENYLTVDGHPELGDTVVAFNGAAFGEKSIAQERDSFAAGRQVLAIGQYGAAFGRQTTAGYAALSEGYLTNALGNYSHAEGYKTKTNSNFSHAEGHEATANGIGAHAEGASTIANGNYSHAEGSTAKSYSVTAHAEGTSTIAGDIDRGNEIEGSTGLAYGGAAHAEGAYTQAIGSASHAEGHSSKAKGFAAHAEGHGSTSGGIAAHAEGYGSIAEGDYSHAENSGKAYGVRSHAEGNGVTEGDYAHAENSGKANALHSHAENGGTASGDYSHAENGSTASGQYSHAEGVGSTASGFGSHAEGYVSYAKGKFSHAEGKYTDASGEAQHVHGMLNIIDKENKYITIVGNGEGQVRSNAYTLDWSGNAWYAGTVETTGVILKSPNGKRFKLSVADDGTLETELI